MLRTYEDERAFRENTIWEPMIDYWSMYEALEEDGDDDDDYNFPLYKNIEKDMCDWIRKNCKKKAFYIGDLNFEFESTDERDAFDKEFGDEVAFKLRFA